MLFGFGVHLSVTAKSTHHPMAMTHANQQTKNMAECVTVCSAAALQKDEYAIDNDLLDDEPHNFHDAAQQATRMSALSRSHDLETQLILGREPPPGDLPAYIALSVFRT